MRGWLPVFQKYVRNGIYLKYEFGLLLIIYNNPDNGTFGFCQGPVVFEMSQMVNTSFCAERLKAKSNEVLYNTPKE